MITLALWAIKGLIIAAELVGAVLVACFVWWVCIAWRERELSKEPEPELGDEAVPYWPSEEPDEKTVSRFGTILFCPVCHPGGHGACTCVAYCGDRQCTYGYTAQLSAEEAAWLRGIGIKEGTDQ